MSYYGDQTHCENLDCVGQLEIGQASYLLNHPHMERFQQKVGHKNNSNYLPPWEIFMLFCPLLIFFYKINFLEKIRYTILSGKQIGPRSGPTV